MTLRFGSQTLNFFYLLSSSQSRTLTWAGVDDNDKIKATPPNRALRHPAASSKMKFTCFLMRSIPYNENGGHNGKFSGRQIVDIALAAFLGLFVLCRLRQADASLPDPKLDAVTPLTLETGIRGSHASEHTDNKDNADTVGKDRGGVSRGNLCGRLTTSLRGMGTKKQCYAALSQHSSSPLSSIPVLLDLRHLNSQRRKSTTFVAIFHNLRAKYEFIKSAKSSDGEAIGKDSGHKGRVLDLRSRSHIASDTTLLLYHHIFVLILISVFHSLFIMFQISCLQILPEDEKNRKKGMKEIVRILIQCLEAAKGRRNEINQPSTSSNDRAGEQWQDVKT
ncbi:uncharacterized protein BT62DRAFT_1014055 [Guyanagaster necrorhizus]|uniref:Uncharacterized protein n=1 Tax=Guyanagaster necrorhizus TaxID=856835 RepID=A0A9P8AM02_9AGAR|nr:uncharacterized protein BT62DRAFT_1014055 [Guyanagaster necrorhizus MCA 3950]KAG7439372.1 hypothetical protein BT62DRAFT_1014055 [Guyanagaster necrorhizus MCA 3950]